MPTTDQRNILIQLCFPLRSTESLSGNDWLNLLNLLETQAFGPPQELLNLSMSEIAELLISDPSLSHKVCSALKRDASLAAHLSQLEQSGFWITTLADPDYPAGIHQRCGRQAPPLFIGCGAKLPQTLQAVGCVGSRDADDDALACASRVGELAANRQWHLVSGLARGVDQASMRGALDADGPVLGFPATGIHAATKAREIRQLCEDERITLLSAQTVDGSFGRGQWAMIRNKYIYASSRAIVVVLSGSEGGTWAGAKDALRSNFSKVLLRRFEGEPPAHAKLAKMGACDLPQSALASPNTFWPLVEAKTTKPVKIDLFANADARKSQKSQINAPEEALPSATVAMSANPDSADDSPTPESNLEACANLNGEAPPSTETLPQTPAPALSRSLELLWPEVIGLLQMPTEVKPLAAALGVNDAQAKAWLQELVDAGLIEVVKRRPKRFKARPEVGAGWLGGGGA